MYNKTNENSVKIIFQGQSGQVGVFTFSRSHVLKPIKLNYPNLNLPMCQSVYIDSA